MVASETQASVLRYIREGRRYYLISHPFLAGHQRQLDVLEAMGKLYRGEGPVAGTYYERRRFATNVFGD